MPLSPESAPAHPPGSPRPWGERFRRWNRCLHYYIGLYLLLFVWLFALSGLLLNQSSWKFAEFWSNRQETSQEREVTVPPPGSDLEQARDLMRQLDLRGELEWTTSHNDPALFDFRISQPGRILEVKADWHRKVATVKRIELNGWGVMRLLHTFSGVRLEDPRNQRDWVLTSVWAWAMDAVAVGLILMVASSLYMWWELPQKRRLGMLALGVGTAVCALFCVGWRWLL